MLCPRRVRNHGAAIATYMISLQLKPPLFRERGQREPAVFKERGQRERSVFKERRQRGARATWHALIHAAVLQSSNVAAILVKYVYAQLPS